MEKKQYELCLEILKRFHKAGILNNFILIGSWSAYFYNEYFAGTQYLDRAALKTRDIDFLIDNPTKIKHEVNVPELLRDLGFVMIYKGNKGYIKLEHPDLLLEFLVLEKGRGIDKPFPLPKLGINAVALRFLSFLSANTIKVKVKDFYVTLPNPANFALHKLIIFQRRLKQDKAVKDRNIAIEILKSLIDKGESSVIKQVFDSIPKKWQAKVVKGLDKNEDKGILAILLNLEKSNSDL
ncbi:MAG: nucleotidyltransferase domain-containing protein [Candidatus Omnitrophica bacterium]|nr:nucleotidyltransferase domain-containing protein [Candidatus Omnitrophota bacterium]MBU1923097.1 nucleotidyltransferase domain-containing protein [Candidatus Omnitrophota bacterium]